MLVDCSICLCDMLRLSKKKNIYIFLKFFFYFVYHRILWTAMDHGTKERAFQEVLCKHPAPFWFNVPPNLILLDKFIHAIVIANHIFVFYVWCVPGSRNGVWTPICMPQKMTTNTECFGEKCILLKKQVKYIFFMVFLKVPVIMLYLA